MRTQNSNAASMPEVKVIHYKLNPSTGYYNRVSYPPGFDKAPEELRVEETARPEKINSKLVIRSRRVNGGYLFFTGLIPTQYPGLFFGDHYENRNGRKVNSFCLFAFSDGNRLLGVHYFNGYKVYPQRRGRFIADYWRGRK